MATQSTTTANADTTVPRAPPPRPRSRTASSPSPSPSTRTRPRAELQRDVPRCREAERHLTLDTYEKALSSVLDFNRSIATAAKFDWVATVVDAQTTLVQGLSAAATAAAREVLQ
ncbi:hypothetical protein GS432_20075 [Rhodococcus hoagii]|nr:hypothetical protein [Prescottella equi]